MLFKLVHITCFCEEIKKKKQKKKTKHQYFKQNKTKKILIWSYYQLKTFSTQSKCSIYKHYSLQSDPIRHVCFIDVTLYEL